MNTIITGSSSGIGFGIAKKLVQNSKKIWLSGRNIKKLKEAQSYLFKLNPSCKIYIYELNLLNKDEINEYAKCVMNQTNFLDNIILNFGSSSWRSNDESPAQSNKRLKIANFDSPKWTLNSFSPLLNVKSSRIIFISSIAVKVKVGAPDMYIKSKRSFEKYLFNLVNDPKFDGIRVNIVRPGHIALKGNIWSDPSNKVNINYWKNFIPLNKFGDDYDVANLVDFLLSHESKYINYTILEIDGGLSNKIIFSKNI